MELSVIERLKLLEILPQAGDLTTIKIVRELRESLTFKEDEHIAFGIETKDPGTCLECGYSGFAASDGSCPGCKGGKFKTTGQQQIYWNIEAARDVEINISPKAMGLIVKELGKLDKSGGVTDQHLTLFDKFVGD